MMKLRYFGNPIRHLTRSLRSPQTAPYVRQMCSSSQGETERKARASSGANDYPELLNPTILVFTQLLKSQEILSADIRAQREHMDHRFTELSSELRAHREHTDRRFEHMENKIDSSNRKLDAIVFLMIGGLFSFAATVLASDAQTHAAATSSSKAQNSVEGKTHEPVASPSMRDRFFNLFATHSTAQPSPVATTSQTTTGRS